MNMMSRCQSTWFEVKDVEAFEAWVEGLDLTVVKEDGEYRIYDGGDGGWPEERESDDGLDMVDIDFFGELQAHLKPGTYVILYQAGFEREPFGFANALHADGRRLSIDIYEMEQKAKEEWGDAWVVPNPPKPSP
jgi:hypothetical protein